jgi:elongation factor Ts
VNCETDFVGKGDDFKGFAREMAQFAADNNISDIEALKDAKSEAVNELTLKCGEKIDLRRLLTLNSENTFGHYNHGGKIGVLVEAKVSASSDETEELLKDLAMHVAAASPKFLDASGIDEDFKAREAKIYTEQLQEQGKPEKMIPQIVEGKLRKLASEVCLLEQSFVKNPDLNVKGHVAEVAKATGAEISILGFHTLNLGEGVEKKVDNLADEVAKMTQQQ